ncbi:YycH family regulatory protein [Trichococcus pasteurii]|uniref:Regulatory protein yych n=1 Tax=Trichococcus pasteurii TaxID=43064 RepID=A0A1W1IJ95_9LACT|nr:two-component system activity regulator YycH [Trichococcus pasteurii]SFE93404.1 Two-component signal transduction system YycFG, regulatory protein YycH [Trichococcus pasteurii]SLM53067.1 regulatory protein yych [Trichococcus pasteurii]SSB93948.1 regulatory protein yych [Trichococcus pasteurii]
MKHKESPMLSALLYTLVAISLFLTVRILSTPSTVGLSQNSTTSVSANLTNTKKVEDVFAPIRMIIHTDKRIYLTQEPEIMQSVNELLSESVFDGIEGVSTYTQEDYDALILSPTQLEIRFAEEVPLELLSRYFTNLQEEYYDEGVDRIILNSKEEDPVYLLNDETKQVFTVARPDNLLQPLVDLYEGQKEAYMEVESYQSESSISYLPTEAITIEKLVYLVEKPSNSYFIDLLFDDTTDLKDNGSDAFVSYSDNISELSIDKETGQLSYYRNILDAEELPDYRLIRDSFHEIKMLDNWTNPFYFYGFDEGTDNVYYRRYVNGYPIFGEVDYGLTQIHMSGSSLTELQFLTQVIQTPLTDRGEDVTLLSGKDLLAALDAGGYSSQEIQMIALGYDWTFSEESNRLVNLTPKWFIQIDGAWKALDQWIGGTETEADDSGL